jgi:hypothetical protein
VIYLSSRFTYLSAVGLLSTNIFTGRRVNYEGREKSRYLIYNEWKVKVIYGCDK